uniref:DDRGK domain-containing protein 1 n=1 Tax=Panagrolaimus sp. JU765 TaxID=591449 RepID=A0AC34PV86_9BILA
MGSLNVQPPSALRNVTEIFIYLRNNRHQTRSYLNEGFHDPKVSEENLTLISLDGDKVTASSSAPPAWVNIIDEISYELDRLQSRKSTLKELQQKHLKRPDFSDEASSKEQEKIKELTEELTSIFTHVRRLIKLLQETDPSRSRSIDTLRENVISSFLFNLNNLLHDFRSSQSHYVRQIDARKKNVDSFLLATEHSTGAFDIFNDISDANSTEELTIDQLQMIVENESMIRDREKEVIKISKSILELNALFKDLASLVLDQGTILDRIDYNVERSVIQIKSAYQNIQKAERYQRNKKMHFIVILAGIMGDTSGSSSNLLYLSVGFLFTVFAVIAGFIFKLYYDENQAAARRAEAEREIREMRPQRPARNNVNEEEESSEDEAVDDDDDHDRPVKGKIGAKKLAKLQAKQEAKIAREAELRAREEKKQREAEQDRIREEARKKEELEELQRIEKEKMERLERERREHEEYLKLKESFVVEEEGQEAKSEEEKENLLKSFVDYIKKTKAVYLDELAPRFNLDVESTIEKIKYFLENGVLTGVFDDRGKFVYISEEEMANVAKFVNQRGRVSLQDLAEYSNQLISFEAENEG